MSSVLSDYAAHQHPQWLELVRGGAPLLLVAPHGGKAGATAHARANPRINDLYTAEITRELARRLSASALINRGMDRNQLDLNRLADLREQAPWFLSLLAEEIERLLHLHPRIRVVTIHGWNIVEPRIDFGVGGRMIKRELRPVGSAHLTASNEFVNGPLAGLFSNLAASGIVATLGYRYPAGGRQNLLQALTGRDLGVHERASVRLARLGGQGLIDALQIELSIAVRWPGRMREQVLDRICETFVQPPLGTGVSAEPVRRRSRPPDTPPLRERSRSRFGVEFYDPGARIGVIASVDLSGGGSRVAVLLGDRVALCTADGSLTLTPTLIQLGPLKLSARGRQIELAFRGPMLIVPDAAAYTRIERALSSSALASDSSLRCVVDLPHYPCAFFFPAASATAGGQSAAFGTVRGELRVGDAIHQLRAYGRIGLPPHDPLDPAMTSRRSLWASVAGHPQLRAFEAGMVRHGEQEVYRYARGDGDGGSLAFTIEHFSAEPPLPGAPPSAIKARLVLARNHQAFSIVARPQCYMATARPGPGDTRIYTAVGFASFELDGAAGTGMFECADLTRLDGSLASAKDER